MALIEFTANFVDPNTMLISHPVIEILH